jgi:DNA-binding CsgD family transcriptional regulator
MAPRLNDVLRGMLAGQSEKQIAGGLGISEHTVHNYVKALYTQLRVGHRNELLALFVVPPDQVDRIVTDRLIAIDTALQTTPSH